MACKSMIILSSPVSTGTSDFCSEQKGFRRSLSGKDISKGAFLQRSYSDNHLGHSISCIRASSTRPKPKTSRSAGMIAPLQMPDSILPSSLQSFLFDPETSKNLSMDRSDIDITDGNPSETVDGQKNIDSERVNWIERLLEIRRHWRGRQQVESADRDQDEEFDRDETKDSTCDDDIEGGCQVDYGSEETDVEEDHDKLKYDHESFSKLLVEVPIEDTKLFAQLAFLSNMAYVIPTLRGEDLRRHYGLRFVTSSIEKKAEVAAMKEKLEEDSTRVCIGSESATCSPMEKVVDSVMKRAIRPALAYDIAASAAYYIQSQDKELLSLGFDSQQEGEDITDHYEQIQENGELSPCAYNSERAAFMAAQAITAVVAAGEKEKQEAALDLQSLDSSPCEWFICDDLSTYTRCFVIQGSDSLASWQANLLFEPVKFEETDGIVHRGIYEAAKGIYNQFMPEIIEHLNKHGDRARFQFTGHSLGGSLALIVHLMLLSRKVLKPSHLHPVVSFGSPFVFCGGQKILKQLHLDEDHVHCVMMHRDIVPRAFACSYPSQIAVLLKRLNGSFRSHPCLIRNKLLYSPLGKLFILQPDEKYSPPHPLLPAGSGFYALDKSKCGSSAGAVRAFLNRPHPILTLSNPTAYGSDGTILRDHDSSNYLKAVNGVLRQHSNTPSTVNEILREQTLVLGRKQKDQMNQFWPLLASPSPHLWSYDSNYPSRFRSKEVMTRA